MRQACDAIGLDPSGQFRRISDDTVYSDGIHFRRVSEISANRETLFLERKFFHRWICGINAKLVRVEIRSKLIEYQLEATEALDDYFSQGFAINERALQQWRHRAGFQRRTDR